MKALENRHFWIAFVLLAAACSSNPGSSSPLLIPNDPSGSSDAGVAGNDSSNEDGGASKDPCTQPKSQPLSAPCCMTYGVDACGAGLFCAAFDRRIQPTCYAERSRLVGQLCNADDECVSNVCDAKTETCEGLPGESCTPPSVCASDASGQTYFCGSDDRCDPAG